MVEVPHHEVQWPHAAALSCGGQQRLGLLDRGSGVLLIADAFGKLVLGRGELGERVDEAPHHQWRDVLHDVDQDLLLEQQMQGAPDARIIERLPFGIDPGRVDHALVEACGGHARHRRRLADGRRVERAGVIHPPRQDGGAQLRGERQQIVEFDAVEIGQALVPVVRVPLHHPDLVLDPPLRLERAGARDVKHLAQIVVVLLERLLADDDVPAAGEGGHHEIDRARRGQLEFDGVLVRVLISLTAVNSALRGMLMPGGGLQMRS